MRISIAMATYNGERFIREQLDSLSRQTQLPHELVVTDDGSSDRTLEILDSFAKDAPFSVRIYRNIQTLGYGDNFLKAASLCEGNWIAFCDQDDVWKENKLEAVSRAMAPEVLLIVHSADLVDADLTSNGYQLPNIERDTIQEALAGHPLMVFPGCCMVFQATLLSLADWENRPVYIKENATKLTHDWWVYVVANAVGKISTISQSLMFYRRHQWTVSGPISSGLIGKVKQSRRVDRLKYDHLAEIAANIGHYFSVSSQQHGVRNSAQFALAAKIYQKHASYLQDRSRLYEADNFIQRVRRLYANARNNAYQPLQSGGLGLRSLLKDILLLPSRSKVT